MAGVGRQIYCFADVDLDPLQGSVKRAGQVYYLRPKTLQVLCYLIDQHNRIVTKDELIETLWADTAVTDDALVQSIVELRKVLGDESRQSRIIKTYPKVGYRFICPVEQVSVNGSLSAQVILTEATTAVAIEAMAEIALTPPLAPPPKPRGYLPTPLTINHWLLAGLAGLGIMLLVGAIYLSQRLPANQLIPEATLPLVPGKKLVVVMFFDNQSNSQELDWLREGLAEMMIANLARANNLTVLSRPQLHLLLERIGYERRRNIRLDEALQLARRHRAEGLIRGSFATLGEKLQVNIQVYDPSEGRLLGGEQLVVDQPDQILTQINLLTIKLATRLGATTAGQDERSALVPVGTTNLEAYRYYSLGVEKALGFENAEAIRLLEQAIQLDSQFALAYARIGYTYALTWVLPDQAKPYLEKAFQMSDRLTEKDRLNITAWYAIANRDFAAAIRTYHEIIKLYPLETDSYYRLARLLAGEGQTNEALEVAQQGLVIDSEAKDLYNIAGYLYSELGHPDQAIATHQQYVSLAPNEPNAYDSLGLTYQNVGRYREAIETYHRGLAVDPEFDILVFHLANTYFHLGRYREARQLYERYGHLAAADGERSLAYRAIGLIHLKKGERAQALAAARREARLEKKPGITSFLLAVERGAWPQAAQIIEGLNYDFGRGHRGWRRYHYWMKGYLALKSGRGDEAIEHFRAALKEKAPGWDIDSFEDCLANAYLELRRYDEAIAEYERLLRLNPHYPLTPYHLGRAYEGKGETDKARAAYERFLQSWPEADPDIPEVLVAKARLIHDSR